MEPGTKPASVWWTSTHADEQSEDVMIKTKKKAAQIAVRNQFQDLVVHHSVAHRPRKGVSVKPNKGRTEPRTLGPSDNSIGLRTEGTTVQLYGDSHVAEKRINGQSAMGQKYK